MELYTYSYKIPSYEADIADFWRLPAVFDQMQEAGGLHSRALGIGRETIVKQDAIWAIVRLSIEMKAYPKAYDEITVTTWYAPPGKLIFERYFEFLDKNGEVIGMASSEWVMLSFSARSIVRPSDTPFVFPAAAGKKSNAAPPRRIRPIPDAVPAGERTALYGDIDLNGHVNNARYIDWICDLFDTGDYAERQILWLNISYKNELCPGQTVDIYKAERDGEFYVRADIRNTGKTAFEAELKFVCRSTFQ